MIARVVSCGRTGGKQTKFQFVQKGREANLKFLSLSAVTDASNDRVLWLG